PAATVADILGCVADRFSLEGAFRDCKEVVGAGQQQVRFVWASVGSFHLCLWAFTMTEAWAWGRGEGELVGHRSASPWDDGGGGGRATPTSGGRGGGNCWAMKSRPFYALGRPSRKSVPPPNACSTWPPDIEDVTERTETKQTDRT